jgi:hypothetical protein
MKYNRLNLTYSGKKNPTHPKIRQILIQTKSADILTSILELICNKEKYLKQDLQDGWIYRIKR